jgi:hypothetical protein
MAFDNVNDSHSNSASDSSSDVEIVQDKLETIIDFLMAAVNVHDQLLKWMYEHYSMTSNNEQRAIHRILKHLQKKNKPAILKLLNTIEYVEGLLFHITNAYEKLFIEGYEPNPTWIHEDPDI